MPSPQPRPMLPKIILACAGFYGLSGTILAALAAHLNDRAFIHSGRTLVQNAVQMQMWHAPALLALGLALLAKPEWTGLLLRSAAGLMIVGLALFCGSVDAMGFGVSASATLAPTGGVMVMGAWACLILFGWRAAA